MDLVPVRSTPIAHDRGQVLPGPLRAAPIREGPLRRSGAVVVQDMQWSVAAEQDTKTGKIHRTVPARDVSPIEPVTPFARTMSDRIAVIDGVADADVIHEKVKG